MSEAPEGRALERKAGALGIEPTWRDVHGGVHRVPDAALEALIGVMTRGADAETPPPPLLAEPGKPVAVSGEAGSEYVLETEDGLELEGRTRTWRDRTVLDRRLESGLHRLRLDGTTRHLLVAPKKCLGPADLGIERCFGVAAQLYSLREAEPSAIGDFAMLRRAAPVLAREGVDLVGLNPLHALFAADASACSPYAPSNRRFLNTIYVDPLQAADRLKLPKPAPSPEGGGELIDHAAAWAVRRDALHVLFDGFEQRGSPEDRAAFESFVREGGAPLHDHALFEALHAYMLEKGADRWAFWTWPEGLRRPDTKEARAFAEKNAPAIRFHQFLQWLADGQLGEAQAAARDAGMRIGLYRDLAVGVNPAGGMVWATPGLTLRGVSIGAPPDEFSPLGQNWGLAPFAPNALAAAGFRPLLADLEANARHAGALRIDHVIGLERQFWVPDGMSAAAGAYVRFPFEVVARLASLVSHRRRALIIGEDLGTVPPGFRRRMQSFGMLSCRVLWFEREGARLRRPEQYPPLALASFSTHDLPTVQGLMEGRDIDWRAKLELFPDAAAVARERRRRAKDKTMFENGLAAEGIEAGGEDGMAVGLHRYLARTRSALAVAQLEDLEGTPEQVNLPGTVDTHPNWRRRLGEPLDALLRRPRARAILRAMREERPK
ncbi:MAG: 4-alpha-glucanotransferase [Geminicoccaceae bacterium]|nr:4-alpha-glucanotransferase [Geminicoccaceae bacterium]